MASRLQFDIRMNPFAIERVSSTQADEDRTLEISDLIVLGSGTVPTLAAWTFASKGQRAAVIERKYIGGSCPHIACLPSKNILHSARVASYCRRGKSSAIHP